MFRLMHSVREYRKPTFWTMFFVVLEVILDVVCPYLMANLIDYGIYKGDMPVILKTGLMIFVFYMLSLVTGFLAGHFAAVAAVGFGGNLREDLFRHIQTFSFSNIDHFSVSSIVTRLTTDINNVQMAYQVMIRIAVRSPLLILFALIMTVRIQVKFVPMYLILIVFLAIVLAIIGKIAYPMYKKSFRSYDKLNQVVEENLKAIRVVKAFVRKDYEEEKFQTITKEIFDYFSKAQKVIATNMPIFQASVFTCILMISWFGAKFIVKGQMNTGQIVSLVQYSMQILIGLMNLSFVYIMLSMSQVAANRISMVLDEETDMKNILEPVRQVKDGSILFQHVNFSYHGDQNLSLKDITLDIKSGQNVGIIGGSGSGKSSLVNLIPRVYDITSGSLQVAGVEVADYDIETLREEVGIVLQKNMLFSGTIKENIRWGKKDATEEEIIDACKKAQAHDFIMEFPDGYDTYIEQGGTNVSGGQRQRLCIARALIKQPKILILDDSTSAVDTTTESKIRQVLSTDLKDATKIIISQRIISIKGCDMILVMDNGYIVGKGTHDQLLSTNEIYQEIYETQEKGGTIGE